MGMPIHKENGDDKSELEEEAHYIGGIIKRVGTFSNETLEGRKQFQKTIYLMQAFGIDLGYEYNWYVHGPYSPDLAEVGYALAEIYDEVTTTRFSNEDYEELFQQFLDYIDPIKNDVARLETAASLHWLRQSNPDLPHDLLIDFLLEEKEELEMDPSECEIEWDRLREYNLVD